MWDKNRDSKLEERELTSSEQERIDSYLRRELSEQEAGLVERELLGDPAAVEFAHSAYRLQQAFEFDRRQAPQPAAARIWWPAAVCALAAVAALLLLRTTGVERSKPDQGPNLGIHPAAPYQAPSAKAPPPAADSTALADFSTALRAPSGPAIQLQDDQAAESGGRVAEMVDVPIVHGRIVVASGSLGTSQVRVLNSSQRSAPASTSKGPA